MIKLLLITLVTTPLFAIMNPGGFDDWDRPQTGVLKVKGATEYVADSLKLSNAVPALSAPAMLFKNESLQDNIRILDTFTEAILAQMKNDIRVDILENYYLANKEVRMESSDYHIYKDIKFGLSMSANKYSLENVTMPEASNSELVDKLIRFKNLVLDLGINMEMKQNKQLDAMPVFSKLLVKELISSYIIEDLISKMNLEVLLIETEKTNINHRTKVDLRNLITDAKNKELTTSFIINWMGSLPSGAEKLPNYDLVNKLYSDIVLYIENNKLKASLPHQVKENSAKLRLALKTNIHKMIEKEGQEKVNEKYNHAKYSVVSEILQELNQSQNSSSNVCHVVFGKR